MIKIKKLIPFFLIIIFLNNCGYTPQYALNKNVNFTIDLVEISGDREFNNFLKTRLKRYEDEEKVENKKWEQVENARKKAVSKAKRALSEASRKSSVEKRLRERLEEEKKSGEKEFFELTNKYKPASITKGWFEQFIFSYL